MSDLINNIINPVLSQAFPVGIALAITERLLNLVISFVRGDRYVKV